MRRFMSSTLLISGILITLFGIGIGVVLPETSLSSQLLFVGAGLALSLLAARLRLDKRPIQRKRGLGKRLAVAALIALVTLIVLEMILSAAGAGVYVPAVPAEYRLSRAPWWVCGDAGCHYDYESAQPACESGELAGRVCAINRQGYADSEDFVLPADYAGRKRILLLGDSFTWGMSAEPGASYAETLSAAHADAIIWNTGIPGTGTNQALLAFDVYAPVLQPQLTILGFVDNDFDDNLLPVDSWVNALDSSGKAVHMRKYIIDHEENVIEFDLHDLEYIQAFHQHPPTGEWERQLGLTRLGSLLLRLRDAIEPSQPATESLARRRQVTRQYLLDLKQAVGANGSRLLVLLAPRRADIFRAGARYQMAEQLMQELEIPYVNPISILVPYVDFAAPPDDHWNSAGHQKIGRLISDCVERYLERGAFTDCDHIRLP